MESRTLLNDTEKIVDNLEHNILLLIELRDEYKALRDRIEELESDIAANMETSQLVIKNVGLIKRRQKAPRTKWAHGDLFSEIYKRIDSIPNLRAVDGSTGEIIEESDSQKGIRVIKSLANPSWRTGALRELEINPDEFCVKTPGGYSIDIEEGIEA